MAKKNSGEVVTKSNALINAIFDLGLQELRLLAYIASKLDKTRAFSPEEIETPSLIPDLEMEIDVRDLAETFGLDIKSAYREIKHKADKLREKTVEFESGGYIVGVGILTKRKYHEGQARLWFKIDGELLPHLMGLRNDFTKYRIRDIYQFKRASTWRVYELLRQYKVAGRRDFDLDEFKRKIGVAGKYPRFSNLAARIIDPAMTEINNVSDIRVEWEQQKRGRLIVGLRFYIVPNAKNMTAKERVKEAMKQGGYELEVLAPGLTMRLVREFGFSEDDACRYANLWHRHTQAANQKLDYIAKRKDVQDQKGYALTVLGKGPELTDMPDEP